MAPLINDVCTNVVNPPSFVKAKIGALPESFKQIIRDSYPNLQTKIYPSIDKNTVFSKALTLAKSQTRWTLTHESMVDGVIEGFATTLIMRFKDDFVIRIQDGETGGTAVDMRSKSRIGKGDLGVNAKRIVDYFEALDKEVETTETN
eukprot:g8086.t1